MLLSIGNVAIAQPCTSPPTAGTSTATPNSNACIGASLVLNLTGNSVGTGQTYQWQSSTVLAFTSPVNVGTAQSGASLTTTVTGTKYYRAAVKCGTSTTYSAPVQVTASGLSGAYTINAAAPVSPTNFQTFTAAVTALTTGCGLRGPVVFNVVANSGPYNEQIIIPNMANSSAVNTVTFNGNGNQLTFSSTNSNNRGLIKLSGGDYIRFNDLNLYASGTYGYGVQLYNNSDNNIFDNCKIAVDSNSTSTNFVGVSISGSNTSATSSNSLCDSNLFTDCQIIGGYYGLTCLGNSTSSQIFNNRFINCEVRNFRYYGIYTSGNDGIEVKGCTISRPDRTSISSYYGFYSSSGNRNMLIDGNKFTDPMGGNTTYTGAVYGIYNLADALSNKPNVWQNNLFYDWQSNGTQYAIYDAGANYNRYYHNTVVLDNNSNCNCATRAVYQTSNAIGAEYKNNIFYVTRSSTQPSYVFYMNASNSSFDADHNDFFITNSNGANIGYFNSNDFTALPAWQTATGEDANSVVANPQFVNISADNYMPAGSIDNLGTPVGTLKDALNANRSTTTPDMGAIEFTQPPCVSPPTAGTTVVSSTSICAGTSLGLSLSGNTIGAGQTVQWQISSSATGPWTNIGPASTLSSYNYTINTPSFFRAVVTCGTQSANSNAVAVNTRSSLAGNYTINQNAASSATNFTSFTDFASALECGITAPVIATVVAGSGPYNEQAMFIDIPGTSATKTVTILGNGNTITYSSSNSSERATLRLENTSRLIVTNLVVKATGTYGYGIQLFGNSDYNIINGCTVDVGSNITSSNYVALAMSGSATSATTSGTTSDCDNNTFSNNEFIGGYYCVTAVGKSSSTRSVNNKFYNNKMTDYYYYGMYNYYQENLIVDGNEFSRPNRTSFSSTYTMYNYYAKNITINGNRIHDLYKKNPTYNGTIYGIAMYYSDGTSANTDNRISNNIFYNMTGGGTIYALYNVSSDWCNYYHNTINIDNPSNTSSSTTYAFYMSSASSNISLFNNIFTISRGGNGSKYLVYMGTVPSNFTANKNDYYFGTTAGNRNVGYYNGVQSTLANWKTATGKDANSVAINPAFTAAASGDLTPTATAIGNIGNPVGVFKDILGSNRSTTTPDIGAYEWPYSPCPPPTNLSVSNLNATTGTANWTASAGAVGYEYKVDLFATPPFGSGTAVASNTANFSGLNGNTNYYLHVRTNCGSNYSSWVTIPFTTLCPSAPTLNPVSALTTTGASFSWSAVPGALSYEYALQTTATPPANGTSTNLTQYVATGLIPNTVYYFHVRSQCSPTNFSAWQTVTFTTVCPATTNLRATAVTPTTATVSWLPVARSQGYQYAVIASATPPASGTFTTTTSHPVTGLSAFTSYWLHVRVKCSNTNYSAWQTLPFTTPCAGTVAAITPGGPTTFCEGGNVVLYANAGATQTYRWKKNGIIIPGATSSNYTATGTGEYTVTIKTTPACSITSAIVQVVALPNPPATIVAPQPFICIGSPLTLFANMGANLSYQWKRNGNNIPNATSRSYNASTAGTYRVVVTLDSLCSTTSAALPLAVSNPQVLSAVGDTICGTGSATLTAGSSANTTLRWYDVALGGNPLDSGANFTTPVITNTTTFYAVAYDGFGQVGPINPTSVGSPISYTSNTRYTTFDVISPLRLLSVDIYPNVPPGTAGSIEIRGPIGAIVATIPYFTTVSAGSVETIPVNVFLQPGTNYRIKQGVAISMKSATAASNPYPYTSVGINITGTNISSTTPNRVFGFFNWQWATGCQSARVPVVAVVDPGPGATISPNPASYCSGNSVTLDAGTALPGFSYQWEKDGQAIPGANTSTYAATAVGSYTVVVLTGNCGTTSAPVQVTERPSPIPVIDASASPYLSTGLYASYQWFLNGNAINGATGQNHPAAYDGTYTVMVTDVNGCEGTSAPVEVSTLGLDGSRLPQVLIYPNPATTVVHVEAPIPVQIRITSMEGKVILTETKTNTLNVEHLAVGLYMIRVTDKNNNLLKVERWSKVK